MKCDKCGYVSFDHLLECKNCQASMAAARESFNFPTAKPAPPSLLGSLLHNPLPHIDQPFQGPDTETSDPFSFHEETGGEQGEFGVAAPGIGAPNEQEEDFSLLDISDEELQKLVEHDAFGSKNKTLPQASAPGEISMPGKADDLMDMEISLEDFFEDEGQGGAAPKETESTPPPSESTRVSAGKPDTADDLEIDLSESDLEDLLKRLEQTTGGKN